MVARAARRHAVGQLLAQAMLSAIARSDASAAASLVGQARRIAADTEDADTGGSSADEEALMVASRAPHSAARA
jgi:hypothetical protein